MSEQHGVQAVRACAERRDVGKATCHRHVLPEVNLHIEISPVGMGNQRSGDAPDAKDRSDRSGEQPGQQQQAAAEFDNNRDHKRKLGDWRPS